MVRIDEAGNAVNDVDAVAGELRLGDGIFGFDDSLNAKGEVGHCDAFFDTVVDAIDRTVVVAGEVKARLAHRFGGDGAGVDTDPADDGTGFDHGDSLRHFGGGDGGALSGRPGADDDEVVFGGTHVRISRGGPAKGGAG